VTGQKRLVEGLASYRKKGMHQVMNGFERECDYPPIGRERKGKTKMNKKEPRPTDRV